ncbi:MAG: protein kinase [Deltaproteobacteria bacterium]|nr:protein kinase [Deltaproteobacteria bacterium]
MSVPTQIGQYRILRTIGAGGMGTVFLGEHQLIGSRAAVKVLHPSLSMHKQIVERFFTEARAMAAIHDPGVVQVFDFGYSVDGTAYIVMELLEGEPLSARLDRLDVLPVGHALRIARQIAGSLDAAHATGVIHRDLKPDNVFLVRDPEALGGARTKILDFGICKLGVGGDARVTQTGVMLGTPVYMSPEQCRDSATIDHRSDIYSLGAVLFHMLTGRPPFDHDSVGELIAAHLHETPQRPGHYAELPETVDALVMACLAKDPAERFKSMGELQGAIDAVLQTLPGNTPIDVPVVEAPSVPTPQWFVDSQHPPAISDSIVIEEPKKFRAAHRFVMAIALFAGVGIGMTATRRLIDDSPTAEAHEAPPPAAMPAEQPAAAPATAPAPVATEEAWPEPIQPPADVEKAVDDIAKPAPAQKTTPATVAAKPRPTIRHSPPPKRTAPPTPTNADTEDDLYDTR